MKYLGCLIFFSCFLFTQNNGRQIQVPPTLIVREAGKILPVRLEKLEVQVSIRGLLAETCMTLTFFNSENRVLEGELLFPLPEGATVCGYALDIDGELVEGVIVEKHQARIAFEKEVRKGIDPGLLEWTKGNNFRTRIYPLPANGRRTIQVRYVHELWAQNQDCFYSLPLPFKEALSQFSLNVSIWGDVLTPTFSQDDLGFVFNKVEGGISGKVFLQNYLFKRDFSLKFSNFPTRLNTVEQDSEGDCYFVVQDTPIFGERPSLPPIQKVLLFWDASLSREKSDKVKELALIQLLCQKWQTIKMDVVVFRDEAEALQSFQIEGGESKALRSFLESVPYDGGTNLSVLKNFQNLSDVQLLFTDGLGNMGMFEGIEANSPFYCISSSSQMDTPFLKYLAQKNNGQFFNLLRYKENEVAEQIGSPSFAYLGAEYNGKEVADVYPSGKESIIGRFDLTGRLLVEEASITLKYGYGNQVLQKVSFLLKRANSAKMGLVPRFWAQKKVSELSIFPDKNQKQLLELGRRYGLVTPGTSLLVLENLAQYVEHNVEPPASRPELRNQWLAKMDELWTEKNKREKDKIEEVVALWQKRVDWWNTDFSGWEEKLNNEKSKKEGVVSAEDRDRGAPAGNIVNEEESESEEYASGERGAPSPDPASPQLKQAQKEEEKQIDIVIPMCQD